MALKLRSKCVSLSSLLTSEEVDFVNLVFKNPGLKLNNEGQASHFENDESEYGANFNHWQNPERLGLIECVGAYKWIPTDKLVLSAIVETEITS